MPSYDRWSLLEKAVMNAVASAANDDMKKAVVRETKQQIDDIVYSWYANEYERTYELRESVTGGVNLIPNGVELEVYHDESAMSLRTDGAWEKWHSHASIYPIGADQRDLLPLWIIKGTQNSLYYNHIPRDYISSTKRSLKVSKRHVKALREGLKRRGLTTI